MNSAFIAAYATALVFVAFIYALGRAVTGARYLLIVAAALAADILFFAWQAVSDAKDPLSEWGLPLRIAYYAILGLAGTLTNREPHLNGPARLVLIAAAATLVVALLGRTLEPDSPLLIMVALLPAALYGAGTMINLGARLTHRFSVYGAPGKALGATWAFYGVLQIFLLCAPFESMRASLFPLLLVSLALHLGGAGTLSLVMRRVSFELQQRSAQASVIEELGNLAAGLYHDIQTPVGQLSLALKRLSEARQHDPQVQKHLGSAWRELRAIEAAAQLVDFLRSDPNVLRAGFRSSNALETVNRAAKAHRRSRGERAVRVAVDVASSLMFFGNPALLSEALVNIFNNAQEAGAELVKVVALPQGDDRILFRLWNDGRRLTDEELTHACQAGWSSKESNQGNKGMGLFMAKRIAGIHSGEVAMRNRADGDGVEVDVTVRRAFG